MSEVKASPYRWIILIVASIASMPMMAGLSSFGVLAPHIVQNAGLTPEQAATAGNIVTWGIWFGFALASFTIGRFGIKKALLCGLGFAAIPQLLMPFVSSYEVILVLRVVQGLCSSCIPCLFAFVAGSGWFPAREGALASGLFLGGINCGAFFGDAMANALIGSGMTVTMLFFGVFALGVMVLSSVFLRNPEGAATAAGPATVQQTEKKGVFSYKATWFLLLLFVPMCTPYWAAPVVWPQYAAKVLEFPADQITTVNLWVSLVGFIAVIGGVVSDGMMRKNGQPIPARLGCILVFMLIAFVGMLAPAFLGKMTMVPLVFTLILVGFNYAGIAVYWSLLGLVYPPDPDLSGKAASLLTFVGNSPVVFLTPLTAWLAEKTSWSSVFIILTVVAVVVMLPALAGLKKLIQQNNPA
jgi:Sugar phosphate permease